MQWTDVIKPPPERTLRQFAGLFLVVFLGFAGWRWFGGQADRWAIALAGLAIAVGIPGLIAPKLVRPIYTGWMVVAFPIGWTVSRVMLGVVFFLVIAPIGWAFRLFGRDVLHLRRATPVTYWTAKRQPGGSSEYFRQF